MVFVPHDLPFQVVATAGAMQGACAGAGGGGGNDDNLTPEQIQKLIKAMAKVTHCPAPAADGTSVEPASKKAKCWHPESGMEGLEIALNSLIEEQEAMEHETAIRTATGAGGAATALAGAGGAATALAETPQVAPAAQPSLEPAPEPIAKAALHSHHPKGPPPVPVGGSSASAGSANPNRSIGAAPIPTVQDGASAASSDPAATTAAATAADPAATTAAAAGTGGAAATTPATGPDQTEQQQTQQKLEQGPIPKLPPPTKADQPATSSTPTEVIATDTPQTSATHVDAPIGVHTGVAKAAKSPFPPLPPTINLTLTHPPHIQSLANDPPASDPSASDPPASDPPASDPPAGDPAGGAAGEAAVVAVTQPAHNWLPAGAWTGRCDFF